MVSRHSAGTRVAGEAAGGQFKSAEHSAPAAPVSSDRLKQDDIAQSALTALSHLTPNWGIFVAEAPDETPPERFARGLGTQYSVDRGLTALAEAAVQQERDSQRDGIRQSLDAFYEAQEGGSGDEEISAANDLADLLESMVSEPPVDPEPYLVLLEREGDEVSWRGQADSEAHAVELAVAAHPGYTAHTYAYAPRGAAA